MCAEARLITPGRDLERVLTPAREPAVGTDLTLTARVCGGRDLRPMSRLALIRSRADRQKRQNREYGPTPEA